VQVFKVIGVVCATIVAIDRAYRVMERRWRKSTGRGI
jgi:hypothetical protein